MFFNRLEGTCTGLNALGRACTTTTMKHLTRHSAMNSQPARLDATRLAKPGGTLPHCARPEGSTAQLPRLGAIPVLIVAYRNSTDVVGCLSALRRARTSPAFEIFICENGGSAAYESLIEALVGENGPCCVITAGTEIVGAPLLTKRRVLKLKGESDSPLIHVGEALENLGYAGGVNAWLRPLMAVPGWPAVWILNPDTLPAPDALSELVDYAHRWGKGMVGSRLVPMGQPDRVHSRGLRWSKSRANACSVDLRASSDFEPDPQDVDSRLDSPSGASMYVTRVCVEEIGLMDERYFLFFEDLEWGLRARRHFGIGYAHRSIVPHAGGTTIGSSIRPAQQSALSLYLEHRNTLLFVRDKCPRWLIWTILMQLCRLTLRIRVRSFGNTIAILRGIGAGLRGETGRPSEYLRVDSDDKGWGR